MDPKVSEYMAMAIFTDARLHTYSGSYYTLWNTVAATENILLTKELREAIVKALKQIEAIADIESSDEGIDMTIYTAYCPNIS